MVDAANGDSIAREDSNSPRGSSPQAEAEAEAEVPTDNAMSSSADIKHQQPAEGNEGVARTEQHKPAGEEGKQEPKKPLETAPPKEENKKTEMPPLKGKPVSESAVVAKHQMPLEEEKV